MSRKEAASKAAKSQSREEKSKAGKRGAEARNRNR